ncbi:MAG: hypothetical protein AB8B53_11140 [Flavobacteriales bacterium]
MKNQDNITQLYQDAFNDFEVQAPAEVYTKVQNQLGRKSLLTLDPTRLNVFYLALLSGIVAWSILGNTSDAPLAEDFKEKTETVSKVLAVQDQASTETTFLSDKTEEEFKAKPEEATGQVVLASESTLDQMAESNIVLSSVTNTPMEIQARVESENTGLAIADENLEEKTAITGLEEIIPEEKDAGISNNTLLNEVSEEEPTVAEEVKRATAPTSVNGSTPESAKAFLDGLKLDRDNQKDLKLKKK